MSYYQICEVLAVRCEWEWYLQLGVTSWSELGPHTVDLIIVNSLLLSFSISFAVYIYQETQPLATQLSSQGKQQKKALIKAIDLLFILLLLLTSSVLLYDALCEKSK